MRKYVILLLSLLFLMPTITTAQKKKLTSAQKRARNIYSKARFVTEEQEKIRQLKEATKEDPDFEEAYWLISQTYKQMGDETNTIYYLQKAAKPRLKNYKKTCYLLGKEYYSTGKYKEARNSFVNAGDRYSEWVKKCDEATELKKHPVPFHPKNLTKVNTDYDDYWPSITADGTKISITVQVGRREGQSATSAQEDIYESHFYINEKTGEGEWSKSESIGSPTNTPQNEGAQSFSVDGRYMFLVKCDQASSVGGCDIYYSIRRGNTWSPPKNAGRPLNTQFWETSPSFSPAGDEIFFSSNRPGGLGGQDIWVSKVKIREDGSLIFTEPTNLGSTINTKEDEFSPFIHADDKTLYFSSKGHPGLGGYDIYCSHRDDKNKEWNAPKNIGYPINTHRDEMGFCVNAQGDKAYLSSNGILKNGRGKDIYEIDLPEELRPERMEFFEGKVWNAKENRPLQAKIEVYKLENEKVVFQSVSDEMTGEFQAFLPISEDYGYSVTKKGFMPFSGQLERQSDNKKETKAVNMTAISIGAVAPLNNIFFDFDSNTLKKESFGELKRIIRFLAENPKANIELAGHTDSIGSREYNIKLSERRAKAVYEYMIKHGVPEDRISYKGYGPDLPIASNETDEGRAKNRRTEIRITKY